MSDTTERDNNRQRPYSDLLTYLLRTRIRRQHLTQELVRHTTLNKLVLRQNAVAVGIHFVEDLLGALVRRVVVPRGHSAINHVVDRL